MTSWVNVQGDEPMMPSTVIAQVAEGLTAAHVDIATAARAGAEFERVPRPELRQGGLCAGRPRPVLQPCTAAVAARSRHGWAADQIRGRVAACRDIRLSGARPVAICVMAAHAAGVDREAGATACARETACASRSSLYARRRPREWTRMKICSGSGRCWRREDLDTLYLPGQHLPQSYGGRCDAAHGRGPRLRPWTSS